MEIILRSNSGPKYSFAWSAKTFKVIWLSSRRKTSHFWEPWPQQKNTSSLPRHSLENSNTNTSDALPNAAYSFAQDEVDTSSTTRSSAHSCGRQNEPQDYKRARQQALHNDSHKHRLRRPTGHRIGAITHRADSILLASAGARCWAGAAGGHRLLTRNGCAAVHADRCLAHKNRRE